MNLVELKQYRIAIEHLRDNIKRRKNHLKDTELKTSMQNYTIMTKPAILCFLTAVFLIGTFALSVSAWETEAAIDPLLRIARTDSLELIMETGRSYNIVWRSRQVNDQRRAGRPRIQAELEWLWRWDRTSPSQVFRYGFRPRVDIEGLVFGLRSPATDLRAYVATNQASVFVGTTRRDWTPRARSNTFRYDIFAPGGIDVNPTLGQHQWQNQMEIAFFGGIRTEYIYGAVEYDDHQRQVRYHLNPFYSGPQDPLANRGNSRCRLRVVYYHSLTRAQNNYCVAPQRSSKKKRSTSNEPMKTPGVILAPKSDCSYWYKVDIKYLNFDQPGEIGQIEPYGYVLAYTSGTTYYPTSYVWRYYPANSAPSVPKATNIYSLRKCLVLQSDISSGSVKVCFKGNVKEYDPATGDDEIAAFFNNVCVTTNPSAGPSPLLYTRRFNGYEGSLKIGFTVKPCDQTCMQNHVPDYNANGVC